MKTIKQQEEIAFNAINFKEAIILLPLMDALTKLANYNRVADLHTSLPTEERDKYKKVWKHTEIYIPEDSAERMLDVLQKLGFEAQIDLREATVDDLELI